MALFSQILVNIATAATMARPAINRVRLTTPRMAALGGPEVTVLGGGFGGLYTALRLVSLDWSGGPRPRVTLVDRHERFAFSPMLYELATGTATCWEVAPLYEDLLAGTGIDFVRGEVRLDLREGEGGLERLRLDEPRQRHAATAEECVGAEEQESAPRRRRGIRRHRGPLMTARSHEIVPQSTNPIFCQDGP